MQPKVCDGASSLCWRLLIQRLRSKLSTCHRRTARNKFHWAKSRFRVPRCHADATKARKVAATSARMDRNWRLRWPKRRRPVARAELPTASDFTARTALPGTSRGRLTELPQPPLGNVVAPTPHWRPNHSTAIVAAFVNEAQRQAATAVRSGCRYSCHASVDVVSYANSGDPGTMDDPSAPSVGV